ncbi:MAG: ExeM/NucH family extracellular endonuclease, partial [Trueperella sp.]|uniref:ExeM/NucH family extracellular endonuclease n=1 Tax=Trueperella sp. TaxID=2699835 RepID=UPI0025E30B0B
MKRRHSLIAALAATVLAVPLATLPAQAESAGATDLIISEYVEGSHQNKYIELYNGTNSEIDLSQYTVELYSNGATTTGSKQTLSSVLAPGRTFVLAHSQANIHDSSLTVLPSAVANFNGDDVLVLKKGDQVVDSLGKIGDSTEYGKDKTLIRKPAVTAGDTNPNDAFDATIEWNTMPKDDISDLGKHTMTGSGAVDPDPSPEPSGDTDPSPEPQPAKITAIADIQGEGESTPLNGEVVTTEGVITALYTTGGFSGFYIQTAGTGATHEGKASHGIFVHDGGLKFAKNLAKGDFVRVSGTATEYYNLTQIANLTAVEKLDNTNVVAPTPVVLDTFPVGNDAREKYEGMLVDIQAPMTITNNYLQNNTSKNKTIFTARWGELGLTPGTEPLRQPSDVYNPNQNPTEIAKLNADNEAKLVNLDDGISYDLVNFRYKNHRIPVSYLDVKTPARAGAHVTFKKPMIIDYRDNTWKIQPTEPINVEGTEENFTDNSSTWVSFSNNERPAAPANSGDLSLATFNVLNYFITTGDQLNCKGYADREGNLITAKGCDARGAADAENLKRQQDKIVTAINQLDASVVGLEEIENSKRFNKDRDAALNKLVAELNKSAGTEKWAAVKSPSQVPASEDAIRLAFIYQPAKVEPVGESKILIGNKDFTGYAREPLAQEFQALDGSGKASGKSFVAVANHFKSKGSLANSSDTDAYQGNNNKLRVKQAQALLVWVDEQFAGKPVFLLGDFNAYSAEDPVLTIKSAHYTDLAAELAPDQQTYQFSCYHGSLDHVFANEKAYELVAGGGVWDINADEPLAFEYSRYNYNIKYKDLYDTTAFRSSDHDPIKINLNILGKPMQVTPVAPSFNEDSGVVTVPSVDGVAYRVGGEIVTGTVAVEPGQTVTVTAEAKAGFVLAEGATTSWEFQAKAVAPEPEPEPEPEPGQCQVMDRPVSPARGSGVLGDATGDRFADLWSVDESGAIHFYV